jgi:proline iminopeptidase
MARAQPVVDPLRIACVEMVPTGDGVRLQTWTSGTVRDSAPVLLIHGGPGLWDYLGPVADMLAPITMVHRFDQRGCGGSDPSEDHTIARYIADIDALRGHWEHERWIVMGHSFGATLALAYAVAHPHATVAMGYLSGVGLGDWHSLYRAERLRRMTPDQRQRLDELNTLADRSDSEEREFRTLSWFTDYADPARGWELALAEAATGHTINRQANRMLNDETSAWNDQDLLQQASALPMPCWFIHGSEDPRPQSTVNALSNAVPRSELHIVHGAGHHLWCECPEALCTLLRRLVLSTSGGGTPGARRSRHRRQHHRERT